MKKEEAVLTRSPLFTMILIGLCLLLMGFGMYSQALKGGFIWDEQFLVVNNSYIKGWPNIRDIFMKDVGAGAGVETNFYRPLQTISYALDHAVWGLNPLGYHITNILLHCIAAFCIYALLYILFGQWAVSLLAAVLFLVHPIHTSTVAYIASRADLLAAVFILICIISYVRRVSERTRFNGICFTLSYIFALLSKEYSLIIPALLLLYSFSAKKKLLRKECVLLAFISAIYAALRLTALRFPLAALDMPPSTTLLERLPGFFVALAEYIRLLVLPFHLHMAYEYRLFSFTDEKAMMGAAIFFFALWLALRTKNRRQIVSFSILWFFTALLPVSNLLQVNAYMSEHWLYIPSIGFFLIAAYAIMRLYEAKKRRWISVACLCVIFVYFSALTFRQNSYWHDKITFNLKTLRYSPSSPKIYNNLCEAYKDNGDIARAIVACQTAISLKADFIPAYYNLADCYVRAGNSRQAQEAYEKLVAYKADEPLAYFELGLLHEKKGEFQAAMQEYRRALAIDREYLQAYNNLAALYAEGGNTDEAIRLWNIAVEKDPGFAVAHFNLAVFYFQKKQYILAVKHCDAVISLGHNVDPAFLELLKPYRSQK
jgi:tetratricopeptide (TPR) repeat protein